MLLSSHLLHEIEVIADDIVMIGNGRIVTQGAKVDLLHAAGTVVRAGDLPAMQRALEQLGIVTNRSGDGTLHADADAIFVGKVALAAGVALTELRSEDAVLEDMFLELTGQLPARRSNGMNAMAAQPLRAATPSGEPVPMVRVMRVDSGRCSTPAPVSGCSPAS